MPTITATAARKDFFRLLERSAHPGHPVYISLRGGQQVVMMSAEEFEGWMETLEIMSDKKLVKKLKKADEDLKRGETVPWEQVKKELKL